MIQVPLEIAWTATVSWQADDITCRIMVFFRIVGFYLSGFILIVISLDRLIAIWYPMKHRYMNTTKVMLITAWLLAPLFSLPQSFIFKVIRHPLIEDYFQCITFGYFNSEIEVKS